MTIERNILLSRLIEAKHNGFVKILTGIRRCGKSFLLFNLFKRHLLEMGVPASHILEINLEDEANERLTNPIELGTYIRTRLANDGQMNYVLIDEIQRCRKVLPEWVDLSRVHPDDREASYVTFYGVLGGLRSMPNVDVYVTGSNSRLLASDVASEFRGRGQVIHVTPLSFGEFHAFCKGDITIRDVLSEYMLYGGMPECVLQTTAAGKELYLKNLYQTIYVRDIAERYKIKNGLLLETLIDVVMSNVGGLVNPTKLANAMTTVSKVHATQPTVAKYLKMLEDAFLVSKASRFDIKGRRYLESPSKYYASDTGLRNARINFRQFERSHLMENVIYCELLRRGYSVDVGIVDKGCNVAGKHEIRRYEVDFVVNRGTRQIYIQSALSIPDEAKRTQETQSLKNTGDSFPKLVITNDAHQERGYDNSGIAYMGLEDFLLDPASIESF